MDGDGKIDFHEFFAASVDHRKILTTENIKYIFNLIDANKDGLLQVEEFKTALPTNYRDTL